MEDLMFISGLLGLPDDQFGAAVAKNAAKVKRSIVNLKKSSDAVAVSAATATASRLELLNRKGQLEPEIQKGLESQKLQMVDTYLSVVKSISGATMIDMLQDGDKKTVGVCMINGGKLEKDEPFMLTGLRLLYGVGTGTDETAAAISPVNFGMISSIIAGGEFEFNANGKNMVPWCSLEIFKTHFVKEVVEGDVAPDYAYALAFGNGSKDFGMLRLENPKLIESQKSMEFNIKWGAAATANSYLKLILIGSRVGKH